MSIALRSAIALTFVCVVNPVGVCAQQLHQPASVAPWDAAWTVLTAAKETIFAPRLYFGSAGGTSEKVASGNIASPLPMVEMESFLLLGQIRNDRVRRDDVGPTAGSAAIDLPTGVTDSLLPLEFFRASRGMGNVQ